MPRIISNLTQKAQRLITSINSTCTGLAFYFWASIKKASSFIASFFVDLYQQLKGWSLALGHLLYFYRVEILRTICVAAFVYLLALNPFIAITVGVVGLFYFMSKRINADLQALEDDPRHAELKASVTNACANLEKFAHASYDLASEGLDGNFARSLMEDFSEYTHLHNKDGIHIWHATPKGSEDTLAIACRGTKFGEFDQSVVMDFDPDGPGKNAFDGLVKGNNPLDRIIIEPSVTKVSLCGHSLGGAISTRLAVEIMKAKVKENPEDANARFANIQELNIAIFNSAGVDEALVDEANALVDKLDGHLKINFYAHFADLDPVTGSGLQLFANKCANNLSVYMVRKHLSLRMFAKVFPFDPTLMHSAPFYKQVDPYMDPSTASLNNKLIKNRQHFYCNKPADDSRAQADAREINRVFSATYSKFICNRVIYNLLKWIGPSNLTAIKELVVLVSAISIFVYYAVAVINAPTFFAYFAAWSALLYIFAAIEVSKTLDDTWNLIVRFFTWPVNKIKGIVNPVAAGSIHSKSSVKVEERSSDPLGADPHPILNEYSF